MNNVITLRCTCEYLVGRAARHRRAGRYDEAMALLWKAKNAFGPKGDVELEAARVYADMGCEEEAARLSAENLAIIREIAERTAFIKEHVDAMVSARKVANKIEGERAKAVAYHDTIAPMLEEIRYHIDKLELIVDDTMWTLPKYRELLFIR